MILSITIVIANAIAILTIALFALLKNPKGGPNRVFFLLALFLAGWLLATAKMYSVCDDPQAIVFWDRIIYLFVVFLPTIFFHLSVAFTQSQKLKPFVVLGYVGSFLFLLLSRSENFIQGVFQFKYGCHSIAQPLHNFFVLFFFAYVAGFFFNTFWYIRKGENPIKRTQAKYLFLSFIIYSIGTGAFLPAYQISTPPFFFFAQFGGALMMAYSIIKYRLMDIRVAVGKGLVYVLSFLTVIGIGGSVLALNNQIFQPFSPTLTALFLLIIGLILFPYCLRIYEKFVSKYFYASFYSFEKVIIDLTEKLVKILKLEELTSLIVNTLAQTIKLDRIGLVLKDPETGKFVAQKFIGFSREELNILAQNQFLLFWLNKTKKPISFQETPWIVEKISDPEERKNLKNLSREMRNLKIGLCLPLLVKEELIGMIFLGNKLSGSPYSSQDFDLLTTLSSQSAIAINNAISYEEIRKRKEELERFYKVTVGRELRMAELKKKIKELEYKLKELQKNSS